MSGHRCRPGESLAISRATLEIERTIARCHRRWPTGTACVSCGATNPLPLGARGGEPLCYVCKVAREFEEHSLPGDHRPPRVRTQANAHKVLDEAQRIMGQSLVPGVRLVVAANLSSYLTIRLAMLGTLEAA